MIRTVYGRSKSGTALIPLKDALNTYFVFSTRVGDALVDKGDGTSPISYTTGKMLDFTTVSTSGKGVNLTYSSAFTGNASVKFLKGLKDVYSWASSHNNPSASKYNITDIETFFSQFPNLYSVFIDEYVYQVSANMAIIKGDLSRFPDSVERVLLKSLEILNVNTDLVLNFSNYNNTSKLKSFSINASFGSYAPKILGDLGKFPSGCNYLNIQNFAAGSAITYTAGKVWASSFDTLYLPIALTVAENNSLSTDMKNSITSAIGGKSIKIGIINYAYYSNITYLQGLGFAVDYEFTEKLIMPLSSNLLDSSSYSNNATVIGTETHSLGGLVTSTGNYAYIPNNTSLDFGTGSLRFGCTVKFSAITGTKGIIGKTYFGSIKGRYGITISGGLIYGLSQMTAGNVINTTNASTYNDGNFHTIEVICNRTTGKQTLTIDGVLINTTSFTPSSDNLALNQKFHIGAYGNTSGGIVASSELNGITQNVFVNKF